MLELGEKRPPSDGSKDGFENKKHASLCKRLSILVLAERPRSEPTASSFSTLDESFDGKSGPQDRKLLSCKCRRSKCLKQYCECYRAGEYCGEHCECEQCMNHEQHGVERQLAQEQTKSGSTFAFAPDWKALSTRSESASSQPTHPKSCRCRRSKCRKKYCECYQMGVPCSSKCECMSCHNQQRNARRPLQTFPQTPTRRWTERAMESEREATHHTHRALRRHAAIPALNSASSSHFHPRTSDLSMTCPGLDASWDEGSPSLLDLDSHDNF